MCDVALCDECGSAGRCHPNCGGLFRCEACRDLLPLEYVARVTPEGEPILMCRACEVELVEARTQ